jgi:serine phosphatase RsbU (regulator of sigma subunit)
MRPIEGAGASILIADDDPLTRRLIQTVLSASGYTIACCASGAETIQRAIELGPDLLLLDVGLPDIDGYEVCRRLRAHPDLAELPIIMVTALHDRRSRIQGIESGADDFISKPFDHVELAARVRTITRLNRYRHVREANRLRQEVEMAAAIQQQLLPRAMPDVPALEVLGVTRPARDVGGDYYDFILQDDRLYFLVADVSGHGLAAALFASTARSTVRALLATRPTLMQLARALNGRMSEDAGDSGMFLTLVLGVCHLATGALQLVNCGHPPPMLIRRDGARETVDEAAQPIGLLDTLDVEPTTLKLGSGDLLALYTDGYVEAASRSGELFGVARLGDLLEAHRDDPLDRIGPVVLDAVLEFSDRAALADDLTLVLLRGR